MPQRKPNPRPKKRSQSGPLPGPPIEKEEPLPEHARVLKPMEVESLREGLQNLAFIYARRADKLDAEGKPHLANYFRELVGKLNRRIEALKKR